MFKLSEIKELIKLVDQTSVSEVDIENEGSRLSIRKHKAEVIQVQSVPVAAPTVYNSVSPSEASHSSPSATISATANDTSNLHKIVSPMVGTFYQSSSPGAPAFV